MSSPLTEPAPGSALGSFLLPDGYRRPPAVAMLREGSVATELTRRAAWSVGERRSARSTSYASRPRVRHAEPVLLIPGFMAGDGSLSLMAGALRRAGYRTYGAGIHANIGCTLGAATRLEQRLESIVARRGERVQVVGHSLGGMLARGLAARRPDLVGGIVTMGSPMRAPGAHHVALTASVGVLVALSRVGVRGLMASDCVGGDCARESFEESQQALAEGPDGVAFTAIYSRRDGVVDWRACLDPQAETVEVRASHLGMAVDPRVLDQVVAALARHRAEARGAGSLGDLSVVEVDRGVGA